jgi:hypothetical protein
LKLFFNEQYFTHHTESPDGHHLAYDGGVVYIPSPHPHAGVSHVREHAYRSSLLFFPDVRNLLGVWIFESSYADFHGIPFEYLEYGS